MEKQKHQSAEVKESTLILAVSLGGVGGDRWGLSIRRITDSPSSSPFFDQPPPPALFYITVTYIYFHGCSTVPHPLHPLLSISSAALLWQQILAGLAVLADIEEAAPEIALPNAAHPKHSSHSPSHRTPSWKQEPLLGSFLALPSEDRESWVTVGFSHTLLSWAKSLTKGWRGYKRPSAAWTIDRQERRAPYSVSSSSNPPTPCSVLTCEAGSKLDFSI